MKNKTALHHFCVLVVGLLCSSAFAINPLGPPVAELYKAQSSFGLEYSHNRIDFRSDSFTMTNGVTTLNNRLKYNAENDILLANLAIGYNRDCDFFLKVGAADIEDSDVSSAIGAGTKITFYEEGDWAIGMIAQFMSYYSQYDEETGIISGATVTSKQDASWIHGQIAIGPKYQLYDSVSVYGGGLLHWIQGEMDMKGTINGLPFATDVDIEDSSNVGGFIGIQIKIPNRTPLFNIEYQTIGSDYAVATQAVWRF